MWSRAGSRALLSAAGGQSGPGHGPETQRVSSVNKVHGASSVKAKARPVPGAPSALISAIYEHDLELRNTRFVCLFVVELLYGEIVELEPGNLRFLRAPTSGAVGLTS